MNVTKTNNRAMLVMAFVLGAVVCATPARSATNYVWTGAVDGDWLNAGNWNSNGVPVDVVLDDGDGDPLSINNGDISGNRIVFSSFGANPVPTSNIPALGGTLTGFATTPPLDVLNGDISFTGLDRGVSVRNDWSTTVGDGDTDNGSASLSLSGKIGKGISELYGGYVWSFTVNADGALSIVDSDSSEIKLSDKSGRYPRFLVNGGSVTLPQPMIQFQQTYVEFQSEGSTFTSAFGGTLFTNVTAVSANIGDELFFRSTTGEDPVATDNGDGTYTIAFPPSLGTIISVK